MASEDHAVIEFMQTIERRMDGHERNLSDLSRAHTELIKHVSGVEKRVERLEDAHQEAREERAARTERDKALLAQITTIGAAVEKLQGLGLEGVKSDVTSIKDGFNRMFWLVAGTIVTGFGALIFIVFRQGIGLL